jgi:phage shock protein PspC (stress-responsive transcriptional regulator)
MNKTLTINISGIIFNIEEDAYEKLKNYISQIKSHFVNDSSCDEIMADIEARIAEMLQAKSNQNKQVLIISDIDSIINTMGRPDEFDDNASNQTNENKSSFSEGNNYTGHKKKRVYRNGEDKVVGGVCSGISMYFDIDPLWLRLAFGVSFLAFGSGLLFYILLWIVLPEAKTTAEKLEMRGEKVDINNIGKQVSEEFEKIKNKFETEAQDFKQNYGTKSRGAFGNFVNFFVEVVTKIAFAFAKFIGIFFIIFGLMLLVVFLSSIFGSSNIFHFSNGAQSISYSLKDLMVLLINNDSQRNLAIIGIFLTFCIPLIMLVYKGLRLILNIKYKNRVFGVIASILFLVGISIMVYLIADVANDFKKNGNSVDRFSFMPNGKVLTIQTNDKDYDFLDTQEEEDEDINSLKLGKWNYKINGNIISMSNIQFDIEKSTTDSFELLISRMAKGNTSKAAYARAESITYKFVQTDSSLTLPSTFESEIYNKWRGQKIRMKLKVPVGKTIFLANNSEQIIYDIKNVTNTLDSEMINRRWLMTNDGLSCVDCADITTTTKQKRDRRSRDEYEEDIDLDF